MQRLIVLLCSVAAACSSGSPTTSPLETDYGVSRLGATDATGTIGAVISGFHSTDKAGAFDLIVENGTSGTIFVYRRWIRFAYDTPEKRLRLEQRERLWVSTGSSADCHWFGGEYVQIHPLERVGLPQTAAFEYDTFGPSGPGSTQHVRLDVAELVVELAWSDKPLMWDGQGCNAERTQQVLQLERGIVTAMHKM